MAVSTHRAAQLAACANDIGGPGNQAGGESKRKKSRRQAASQDSLARKVVIVGRHRQRQPHVAREKLLRRHLARVDADRRAAGLF